MAKVTHIDSRGAMREALNGKPYAAAIDQLVKHAPVRLSELDEKAIRFLDYLEEDGGRAAAACEYLAQALEGLSRKHVTNWRAYVYSLLRGFDENAYRAMKGGDDRKSRRGRARDARAEKQEREEKAVTAVDSDARKMSARASEFVPGNGDGSKILLSTAVTQSSNGRKSFNPAAAEFVPAMSATATTASLKLNGRANEYPPYPGAYSTTPYGTHYGAAAYHQQAAAAYHAHAAAAWNWSTQAIATGTPTPPAQAKAPSYSSAAGVSKTASQKQERRDSGSVAASGSTTAATKAGAPPQSNGTTNTAQNVVTTGTAKTAPAKESLTPAILAKEDDGENSDVNASDPSWAEIKQLQRRIDETREEHRACGVNPANIDQQPEMKALLKRLHELEGKIRKASPAVIYPYPLRPYVCYIMRLSQRTFFAKRLRQ